MPNRKKENTNQVTATALVAVLKKRGIKLAKRDALEIAEELDRATHVTNNTNLLRFALAALSSIAATVYGPLPRRVFEATAPKDALTNEPFAFLAGKDGRFGLLARRWDAEEPATRDVTTERYLHTQPEALGEIFAVRIGQELFGDPEQLEDLLPWRIATDQGTGESVLEPDDDVFDEDPVAEAVDAFNQYAVEHDLPEIGEVAALREAGHLLLFKPYTNDACVYALHRCDGEVTPAMWHPNLFDQDTVDLKQGMLVLLADSLVPEMNEVFDGQPCFGTLTKVETDDDGEDFAHVDCADAVMRVPLETLIPIAFTLPASTSQLLH